MSWTLKGSQKRCFDEPKSSEVGGQEFWDRDMENGKIILCLLLYYLVFSSLLEGLLTMYLNILII
jgi:hypothetical protein